MVTKLQKDRMINEIDEFTGVVFGSNMYDMRLWFKTILKALELKEKGLKSTDIGIKKWCY